MRCNPKNVHIPPDMPHVLYAVYQYKVNCTCKTMPCGCVPGWELDPPVAYGIDEIIEMFCKSQQGLIPKYLGMEDGLHKWVADGTHFFEWDSKVYFWTTKRELFNKKGDLILIEIVPK